MSEEVVAVLPFWFCSECGDSFDTAVRDTCPTCFPRRQKAAQAAKLESLVTDLAYALSVCEEFRLLYRKGKLEMYAEGGVVQEAAMRLLPCGEDNLEILVKDALALVPEHLKKQTVK